MRLTTKIVIGSSGLVLSMIAGGGIAAADPDSAIVNSTCTYPQVVAALTAEDPAVAGEVTSNPVATGYLQQFVASGPDGRRQMINQARGVPAIAKYTGLISQVATTCNNY